MPEPYLSRDQLAEYVGKRVVIEALAKAGGGRKAWTHRYLVTLAAVDELVGMARWGPDDVVAGALDLSRVTAIREAGADEA